MKKLNLARIPTGLYLVIDSNKVPVPGDHSGHYYQSTDVDDLLGFVRQCAQKFVTKVEDGRARSKETYADMKEILRRLDQ